MSTASVTPTSMHVSDDRRNVDVDRVHPHILGDSKAIREALALARRLAPSGLPILLLGETGTGKELFAQEIHRSSARRGPIVDVNCAALPRDMIEAMLFGHRRGSFTSASTDSMGLIEASHAGTLFLDELQSLAEDAQAKLLRALETGEIRRVGETHKRTLCLRTVSAAQPRLADALQRGAFRDDLLQRVAGAVIHLPSLVDRPDDIPILAAHFARLRGVRATDQALDLLMHAPWPGNVRELKAAIERAAWLATGEIIDADTMRQSVRHGITLLTPRGGTAGVAGEASSDRRLLDAFAAHNWNAAATAKSLGVGRTTLFKELKALGMSMRELRTNAIERLVKPERSRGD